MQPKHNSEKKIKIDSGALILEGLFNPISTDKGVVVAHPHPLYGGDMHNNVVEALCRAYNESGISSLRFNFRGIGLSEGSYDNGAGEQDDIEAAINFLAAEGVKQIDLAGYSFGSWTIALGIKKFANINNVIMVSPPVDIFDYSSAYGSQAIKLVIAGSEDNIADWHSIKRTLPLLNPDAIFKVIQGADHFYGGKTDEIKKIVMELVAVNPAGRDSSLRSE
jgi:uncharacterized protein